MPTNAQSELAAIRTSAAIYPLTSRAFLRITGSDATRWLNGMVTNNIAALAPGEGNYNFLLNAQGRIQGDCAIYREPGDGPATYLLETDAPQLATIQTHLDKFIIMDDVELTRGISLDGAQTDSPLGIAIIGPKAEDMLSSAMMTANELPLTAPFLARNITRSTYNGKHPSLVLAPPNATTPWFEIWSTNATDYSDINSWLAKSGVAELNAEAIEAIRILSAIPKFGVDIRDKDLPQETAQTHALHFSKGCYLGQEIVERIHSRGQVHRIFTQFTLTGELPTLPAPLESNGKPAGELTSAALIDGTLYALGYARREFLEIPQPLAYTGGTATPKLTPKT